MDVKEEVLSKEFSRLMKIFKIDGEDRLLEDMMKMHLEPNGPISTSRKILLSWPRENAIIQLEWSILILIQGG